MDSHGSRFQRGDAAELVGVELAAGCAERHWHGESSGPYHAHGCAVFQVCGYEQWKPRSSLQRVQFRRRVQRRADRDDDAADAELIHPCCCGVERISLGSNIIAEQPRHDELAHLFWNRQRFQNRVSH